MMESILFEQTAGVAYITMNRPDKFNAFNRPMALRLQEVLDACAADDNIRAVYLTGNGKAFCVNLALCCDIVVATASASFIQAFSKIGLIPDTGGTFFLPRLIGWQKASALMMLGDKVDAAEAERLGMLYKVYADEQFADASKQLAQQLAQMPTKGLAYTKKALQWAFSHTLDEQLMNEDKLQQRAAATADFKEGVQAFVEKRKPVFTGK